MQRARRAGSGASVPIKPERRPSSSLRPVFLARTRVHPGSGPGQAFARKRLVQRLRHKADSKNRLPGLVQKLHFPLGVFFELAGNSADDIGANAGQLVPGSIAIGKLGALIGSAGIAAISDAEEIEWHGITRCAKTAHDAETTQDLLQLIPNPGIDQDRVFTGLSTAANDIRRRPGASCLLALRDPDQAVPGDDGTLRSHDDVAKADQLGQVRRRHRRAGRGDRDFDQRGELFGCQKLGCMNGHLQLAITSGWAVIPEGCTAQQRCRKKSYHLFRIGEAAPSAETQRGWKRVRRKLRRYARRQLQRAIDPQLNAADGQQADPGFRLAALEFVSDSELSFPDTWRLVMPTEYSNNSVIHGNSPTAIRAAPRC